VFQYAVDVMSQTAIIVAMVGSTSAKTTSDPVDVLNSVCYEGWELVNWHGLLNPLPLDLTRSRGARSSSSTSPIAVIALALTSRAEQSGQNSTTASSRAGARRRRRMLTHSMRSRSFGSLSGALIRSDKGEEALRVSKHSERWNP